MKTNKQLSQLVCTTLICIGIPYYCCGQMIQKSKPTLLQISPLSFKPDWAVNPNLSKPIMTNFNPMTLPFFCKMEHQIEKKSKIPFRFRLGSLNYVNMLENKG